ncbi:MAG: Mrp/NBP35 family ATP-binding protein [Chloroflexota bacterium]
MPNPIPGINRILAIASGKGGVGKTTVTVNLALALALSGARVGLFDADVYGPNVPVMLGVRRNKPASGAAPIGRADNTPYIKPLERFGLRVMSIGLLVGETEAVMPDPNFIGLLVTRTMKDVLWGDLDYLLIDLPPGTGEPQGMLTKMVQIDGAVVVTTPQDLSLMDAGRSLGLFRKAGVPIIGVVENMSYLTCPHCDERIEVFHRSGGKWSIQDEELELLGRIPLDINISRGIDAGHPLIEAQPNAQEAAIFREIAGKIVERMGQ